MTDFYNEENKNIQCGICGVWLPKHIFVTLTDSNSIKYACCKACANKFILSCSHKGTTRLETSRFIKKIQENEDTGSYIGCETEIEKVICNLCNKVISSKMTRRRYNSYSRSGVDYGTWEQC